MVDVDDELARGHEQVVFLAVGEDPGGGDVGQQAAFQGGEPLGVVSSGTYPVGTLSQPLVGGDIGVHLADANNPVRHLVGDGGVEEGKDRLFHRIDFEFEFKYR